MPSIIAARVKRLKTPARVMYYETGRASRSAESSSLRQHGAAAPVESACLTTIFRGPPFSIPRARAWIPTPEEGHGVPSTTRVAIRIIHIPARAPDPEDISATRMKMIMASSAGCCPQGHPRPSARMLRLQAPARAIPTSEYHARLSPLQPCLKTLIQQVQSPVSA